MAESYVQLLTPTRDDSPVAKYLEKKGEGMHHIGYRVADCAEALESLRAQGARLLDEVAPPRLPGHHGRLRPPQVRLRHPDRAGPGVSGGADRRAGEARPLMSRQAKRPKQ